jgi:hypothetical protein
LAAGGVVAFLAGIHWVWYRHSLQAGNENISRT